MARNKYPEETINLILDVSLKLFLENGYENTTIQDIINNLGGLSKGAVYHHFKGKEELLLAVSDKLFTSPKCNVYQQIIQDNSLNAKEKMGKYIDAIINNPEEIQMRQICPDLTKTPEFLVRILNNSFGMSSDCVRTILEQGVKEGTFNSEYTNQFATMFMVLINFWSNPLVIKINEEELKQKLMFMEEIFQKYGWPDIWQYVSTETYENILKMANK